MTIPAFCSLTSVHVLLLTSTQSHSFNAAIDLFIVRHRFVLRPALFQVLVLPSSSLSCSRTTSPNTHNTLDVLLPLEPPIKPRLLAISQNRSLHRSDILSRCLSNRPLKNTSTKTSSPVATRLSIHHLFHLPTWSLRPLHLLHLLHLLQLPRSSPAILSAEAASTSPHPCSSS